MKIKFSRPAAADLTGGGLLSSIQLGSMLRSPCSGLLLLRNIVFRAFFPAALLTWLFFFAYANRGNAVDQAKISDSTTGESRFRRIESMDHLVVVAGHSVMRLSRMQSAGYDERSWYLLPYQLGQGFPTIITSHVQKGIDLTRQDVRALLIFSGGQTRADVGPLSEAASYYYLAEQNGWLLGDLKQRVFLEEYARDSYENLLFSICRFRELTGGFPTRITVIGFDFKSQRFNDIHRHAIGFPVDQFTYVGMRPTPTSFDHSKAAAGEINAVQAFKS
jgi:hypothetical protein